MFILYSSNTGYTEQYAKLLSNELDLPAYNLKNIPPVLEGGEVIYLGWLMAGSVVGYQKAARRYNVKCVIGVGMSPESDEQTAFVAGKIKAEGIPVFYLQGGYDYKKLTGIYKLMMKVKTPDILKRFKDSSESEKEASATYRMVTRGDSVVSKGRLAPIAAWYRERHEN